MSPRPTVIVFAGPNGSGKSTLTDQERTRERTDGPFPDLYINPDEIARALAAAHPELSEEERKKQAWARGRELRRAYRKQRLSFAFESVFSHPSNLRDLELLRDAGYHIELNWVTTADPEINVGRVCARRDAGGHFIEPQDVRNRYHRGMRFLPRAVETADRVFVYDNSQGRSDGFLPCFDTEGSIWVPDPAMPGYLRDALLRPLGERQTERGHLRAAFGERFLVRPDEEKGVYEGALLYVGAQYAVQEQATGSPVWHDLSVLPPDVDRSTLASRARVRIDYEGWYRPKPTVG